jgi:NADH-quinone oxidoreductase subunit E
MKKPFEPYADYQPNSFSFQSEGEVNRILGKYPKGYRQAAVMPLLDLAQREVGEGSAKADPPHGGWIPRAAMEEIARILDIPPIRVEEVATFYTMYFLQPVGRHVVQLCTTTPCWLCNSDAIVKACTEHLGIGMEETTADWQFTLMEVECLGACVNAPMAQIGDNYYEDLTPQRMVEILDALKAGEEPPVGSQTGRRGSMAEQGPTSLHDKAKKAGILE